MPSLLRNIPGANSPDAMGRRMTGPIRSDGLYCPLEMLVRPKKESVKHLY